MITMIGFKFASKPYYGWELGLKKHGDTYIHIDEFNANSKYNADCYYQTNLLKPKFNLEDRKEDFGKKFEFILNSKKPFIVAESAIFREYGLYKRFGWWSYGWEDANFNNDNVDDYRWKKFESKTSIKIKDWTKQGENILIMGQKEGDSALIDIYKTFPSFQDWVVYTIIQIRKYTDRHIIFRPHPMNLSRGLRSYEKIIMPLLHKNQVKNVSLSKNLTSGSSRGGEPLQKDLKKAYCVVTYNSLSAVEAVTQGIPVFAANNMSMVWPIAHKKYNQIEKLSYNIDIQDWKNKIAYTMWNKQEVKDGETWAHLKPVYF